MKATSRTLLVLLVVLGCFPAFGQGLPTASPESVGLSAQRLERIGSAIQRNIDEKRIAGAVSLVARKGRVAWFKAQGMMDVESGKTMQPDAIFRICSMSKPVTSAAVMMLYEEGKFLLSDPVSKYIPEFKDPKVLVKPASGSSYTIPAGRDITIRQLLTHTSGLTYHWNPDLGPRYLEKNVAHGLLQYNGRIGDSVKILAGLPLLFVPGDKFEYSLSVDVLGYLVEVVSGMRLDDFFSTRLFGPLGMKDTQFFLGDDKVQRLATAYTYYSGKGLNRFPKQPIVEGPLVYSADYPYTGPKTLYSGGAGLCSTVADYARFCQMMLDGGTLNGTRVLSRKSTELMTQDHLGKIQPDFGFGLGFGISGTKAPLDELGSPGKFGWGGFFYTQFFVDPKENMIGIFMAQLHPDGDLNLQRLFETLCYQAIVD
ncbi:MAG TPA: serine hydrolase domain-containing protein [Acidobacteriota bacterium]|nr:serine hydrolase domain-containing protein [Acidobacteriota bacterium]